MGFWLELLSLPSRERGLKFFRNIELLDEIYVAPLAGAWIEMHWTIHFILNQCVAPLAGAWIEIAGKTTTVTRHVVSLPSRERGLK